MGKTNSRILLTNLPTGPSVMCPTSEAESHENQQVSVTIHARFDVTNLAIGTLA